MIQQETVQNFFTDLGIDASHTSPGLERLASVDSKTIKDLKLNVNTVLNSSNIKKSEALLLALAVAVNEKNAVLIQSFEGLARKEGVEDSVIAETHACTLVMATNNIFYRFKHWMHDVEYYTNQPAGLRMSVMMNPAMGKELFELMSLVVSSVNGCERCVTSHEASVKQHGATEARIYDAIRLGAVIRSISILI